MNKIITIFLMFVYSNILNAQEMNYQLSSHILDITQGVPASGVKISLSKLNDKNEWIKVDEKITDENGKITDFLKTAKNLNNKGTYKLTYFTKSYFENLNQKSFYPYIDVIFEIQDNNHYHVPITLSPFGYSTYRGS